MGKGLEDAMSSANDESASEDLVLGNMPFFLVVPNKRIEVSEDFVVCSMISCACRCASQTPLRLSISLSRLDGAACIQGARNTCMRTIDIHIHEYM